MKPIFVFASFFFFCFDPNERRQRSPSEKICPASAPSARGQVCLCLEHGPGLAKAVEIEELADELQGDHGLCRRGRRRRF